jgi:hypothetical protein
MGRDGERCAQGVRVTTDTPTATPTASLVGRA